MDVNDPEHVDPILTELWQIREEFAARFNYDMDAMGRYLMALEQQGSHRDTEAQR